jgi:haloalkane dehalogenase
MNLLTTPEERFAALPDFAFAPKYASITLSDSAAEKPSSARIHYVDEGSKRAPAVLLLHGEASWSFLYRKTIARLAEAGLRVIAPDLLGFGRSDKLSAASDYTYQGHVDWLRAFIASLGLADVALVAHDWGGLLGLRLVAERPSFFRRVLVCNTSLPTGERPPPTAFLEFRRRLADTDANAVSAAAIVASACQTPLSERVRAAYDAPFPSPAFQAGLRSFPGLLPTSIDDPASERNREAWRALADYGRPFLTVFGARDPFTAGAERAFQRRIPGALGQPHRVVASAGHFLQEDAPEELNEAVLAFAREPE